MEINYIKNIAVVLVLTTIQILAQNQPPVVTNVTFTQRLDESLIVDIYYDVNDPDGDAMNVAMQVSDDNGSTWNFTCNQLSGAFGSEITSGTQKHIEWNFAAEHPQTFGDQFKIKIIADDGIYGEPCPGIPTITYEGKIYNTVQIGDQCWLKENLDVGTRIDGSQEQTYNVPTNIIEKYCYDNLEANCTTYGGLYQWNEAMKYVTNEGAKGICPTGWHIPRLSEFETLSTEVGGDGNTLKEIGQGTGGGAGTNLSGFSALLAGSRYPEHFGIFFEYLGINTRFWSSTEYNYNVLYASYLFLYGNDSNIGMHTNGKGNGFSVRCVKD